jgi:uncharacterized sodium:solute symporter family permease YidK
MNFSNTSQVGLHRDFINSRKAEIAVTVSVVDYLAITTMNIFKQDFTNFLLAIQFGADITHMEGFTRTGNHATCIRNGIVQFQPFHAANRAPATCLNF